MESTEHVRKEPVERLNAATIGEGETPSVDGKPDQYAQSELETRLRRIELSIEKARRTT